MVNSKSTRLESMLLHCGVPGQESPLRSGGAQHTKGWRATRRRMSGQKLRRRPDTCGMEWLNYLDLTEVHHIPLT